MSFLLHFTVNLCEIMDSVFMACNEMNELRSSYEYLDVRLLHTMALNKRIICSKQLVSGVVVPH